MNKILKATVAGIILIFSTTILFALEEFPAGVRPQAWVNDYAGLLSDADEQYLNRKLGAYEDTTSTQIFIVTLTPEMHGGQSIEAMGAEIGEAWHVGQQGQDNGLVILIYPQEHELTIQTGYGLEGLIPDAVAKRIIEKEITPRFKEDAYKEGLDEGTDVIFSLLSGEFTADQYAESKGNDGAAFGFFFIFIIFYIWLARARRRRPGSIGRGLPFWLAMGMMNSSNRHHGSFGSFSSGSGSFGGFSGGGGGSFGGGGASGSW